NQLASVGHSIACVDSQVHQDLFNLHWIGVHGAQIWSQNGTDCYVFHDGPAQQPFSFSYHPVQVNVARLQNLPPAEGQELPGEDRRLIRSLLDLSNLIRQFRIQVSLLGQGSVAGDNGEQVIEVVGHAAGQAAY